MKLAEWLEKEGLSRAAFAAEIGVHEISVSRYVTGERIPEKGPMERIAVRTKCEVTANDFYNFN